MFPTNNTQTVSRISESVSKGASGIIVLPQNPSVDAVAASTALYLGLLKLGKQISIICSSPVQSDLAGADKIQSTLAVGGDNLVVSFPYSDGSIDKIDYNIQGQFFNLTITPRAGFPKLNQNQVSYSYTGGTFDFIIAVDVPNLNTLGPIYTDNQTQFQGKNIINIDRHLTNGFYGTVNFVNKTSSSTSELMLKTLQGVGVEMDRDIATNLYAGIATATNNFTSYSVNAETFETIATLLKAGAVKKAPKAPSAPQPQSFSPASLPRQTPHIPTTPKTFEQQTSGTISQVETASTSTTKEGIPNPQDWLKPKIFKGGGLV
ncbi:hypothetical protein COY62_00150 [bacterium (Candidatus Howlettbacteria) CG_4_10_14_0_8_um_filter_40_9]|nr:MAG: hypothetical protein COY62_00150 [bacterium (Candidatus Howlettbacteria) CG_4_10_14_0_8_um_filter_40_9]